MLCAFLFPYTIWLVLKSLFGLFVSFLLVNILQTKRICAIHVSVCTFFIVDSFSQSSHAFSDKLISSRLHKQTEKKRHSDVRWEKKNEDNLNWYCNYKCVCYWQWYCSLGTSSSLVYFVWRIKIQRENIYRNAM